MLGEDEGMRASLESVRQERRDLLATELRLSYWRNLIHARLDQLAAGRGPVVDATRVGPMLSALTSGPRTAGIAGRGERVSAPVPDSRSPAPASEGPGVTAARRAWAEVVDPEDPEALAAASEILESIARSLSAERADLHRRIDTTTAELIRRYRADPLIALDALPDPR